jgi:S1-C subfamily serine protease
MILRIAFVLALLAGCAPQPPEVVAPAPNGLLPGSIGVLARQQADGLVVAALQSEGPAASAGVRPGDIVLLYNGVPVSSLREFNRRVLDTPPGSTARVEVLRDGERRVLEIPVRELDTMPRV